MRNKNFLLAACLLAFGSALYGAEPHSAAPDPVKLLDSTLEPAKVAYRGHMMVVHWFGKRSHAEEVNVFYAPANKYRWEFLSPGAGEGAEGEKHEAARIVISDGVSEWVSLPRQHQVLKGDAIKSGPKRIDPEAERQLLLKNYDVSIQRADKIIGRPVWILLLNPKVPGKFHERLWIDQETGVVLETRRFLPKRPFATLSRFSKFEPAANLSDGLFQMAPDSSTVVDTHGLDPDFMSLESLNRSLGKEMRFPEELPGGFVFESADFLPIQGSNVPYLRYTDGLTVLSLFQTDRPVRMPEGGAQKAVASIPMPGTLEFTSSGKILMWKSKSRRRYYTLIGEVSQELLQQVSAQLP